MGVTSPKARETHAARRLAITHELTVFTPASRGGGPLFPGSSTIPSPGKGMDSADFYFFSFASLRAISATSLGFSSASTLSTMLAIAQESVDNSAADSSAEEELSADEADADSGA